jgi:hypothetical protein
MLYALNIIINYFKSLLNHIIKLNNHVSYHNFYIQLILLIPYFIHQFLFKEQIII